MKATIKSIWDINRTPETEIKFSESFSHLSRIERLDFLQDTLGELMALYDAELERLGVNMLASDKELN